jgi:hypothetical protein
MEGTVDSPSDSPTAASSRAMSTTHAGEEKKEQQQMTSHHFTDSDDEARQPIPGGERKPPRIDASSAALPHDDETTIPHDTTQIPPPVRQEDPSKHRMHNEIRIENHIDLGQAAGATFYDYGKQLASHAAVGALATVATFLLCRRAMPASDESPASDGDANDTWESFAQCASSWLTLGSSLLAVGKMLPVSSSIGKS